MSQVYEASNQCVCVHVSFLTWLGQAGLLHPLPRRQANEVEFVLGWRGELGHPQDAKCECEGLTTKAKTL